MNGRGPASLRRYKPYPSYKDSGVKWLGEIPADWQVRRLKTLISEPITDGPHETPEFLPEGIPFLSVDGIQEGELVFDGCRYISEAAHKEYRRKCAPRCDDILLGKAASTGKIARVKVGFEFGVWSPLALIRPDCARVRSDFLEYALKSAATQAQIDILCTSNTQKNISMRDIPILVVCVAPLPQQRAIAAFLDRETAKIDALVAKKERVIELLQEKRTALITRAVTKGLDPDVRMKDSGVEWLGEIPAHWDVKRTKYAARLRSGHTPSRQHPEYWEDCTIPWFGLADVWQIRDGQTEYVTDTAEKISELGLANSAARLLPKGTVVLSRTASVGFSAIMGADMATTQDFVNWVCGPNLRPEYLLYVFRSMQHEFRRLTMGSTHQTIYMPDVGGFSTPLPPIAEQDRIVAFVREHARRIDALVARVRDAIARLKELRTALISAAVTGKIDVREGAA